MVDLILDRLPEFYLDLDGLSVYEVRLLGFPFYGSRQQVFVLCVLWEKILHCALMSRWVNCVPTFPGFQNFPNTDLLVIPFIDPGLEL